MTAGKIGLFFFMMIMMVSGFTSTINNPCEGAGALLNMVDRPSAADSVCEVPFHEVILELGYQYQWLIDKAGTLQDYAQPELRIGLPANNELFMTLPNYFHLPVIHTSGLSSTGMGIKHLLALEKKWLASIEGQVIFPGGGKAVGSENVGGTANIIINYIFTEQFNVTAMLGASSLSDPPLAGGRRYNSFNPIINLAYAPNEKINIYGEVYGQTKTGGRLGGGVNFGAGFLYLVKSNIAVDISMGQRLAGTLEGFNHYVGTGITLRF